MNARNERGFTIVEVVIAIMLLTVGVMALAGSSALVTRMVGRGKESTVAAQKAAARAELLRQWALSTSPPCTAAQFKSDSTILAGEDEAWTVENLPGTGGKVRVVRTMVRYAVTGRGYRRDTLTTSIQCN